MKQPETSLAAYRSQTNEKLAGDYARIIDALGKLGKANYETIANVARMERHAVGRRLKELEEREKIYKPGTKSETKTGRAAFDYCLTDPIKVEQSAKKAVSLLNGVEKIIQSELFAS